MSNQDMITAIVNAIQDDEQLLTLIRALATNNLPSVPTQTLQMAMQVLGLPTS